MNQSEALAYGNRILSAARGMNARLTEEQEVIAALTEIVSWSREL